jgi:hypothetical protein
VGCLPFVFRHCRHKVFNSAWTIDGVPQDKSLFEMIKTTHKTTPDFTVSAYSDNAAVLEGEQANVWAPDYSTGSWKLIPEVVHILTKVEVSFMSHIMIFLVCLVLTQLNRLTTTPLPFRKFQKDSISICLGRDQAPLVIWLIFGHLILLGQRLTHS